MVFVDDEDRERFLELLAEVALGARWRGYAYCLMGNHFHLAFETPNGDLPDGMRDLMGRFARSFNQRHRRSGHVFGGRYRAEVVASDGHLLAVVRYIARNPVAAGLVADPVDWSWGSYAALVRGELGHTFVDRADVLGLFHRHRWRARAALRYFVLDGLVVPRLVDPRPLSAVEARRRPSVWQVFCALPPLEATHLCRELGYTHEQIACVAGVTRSAISYRLRSGRRAPGVFT